LGGSLVVALASLILAMPIGLSVALYVTEFAGGAARRSLVGLLQALGSLPSVVIGTFGMLYLWPFLQKTVGVGALGLFVAVLLLAILLLPTVSSLCVVAIEALPPGYREGAIALGAGRWQAVYRLLLPAARGGLVQAAVLAFGRALGETMIVLMATKNDPVGLLYAYPFVRPITAALVMEVPYAAGEHRAALFGAGAVLLVLILLVNALARRMGRG
jgi:ABC-type phosphate transport system permease subunit